MEPLWPLVTGRAWHDADLLGHALSGGEISRSLVLSVRSCFTTVLNHAQSSVTTRNARVLRTLAQMLDFLSNGQSGQLGDLLVQRFKAVEPAPAEGKWNVAQHLELIPPMRVAATGRELDDTRREEVRGWKPRRVLGSDAGAKRPALGQREKRFLINNKTTPVRSSNERLVTVRPGASLCRRRAPQAATTAWQDACEQKSIRKRRRIDASSSPDSSSGEQTRNQESSFREKSTWWKRTNLSLHGSHSPTVRKPVLRSAPGGSERPAKPALPQVHVADSVSFGQCTLRDRIAKGRPPRPREKPKGKHARK